jgi:hypothetical protein
VTPGNGDPTPADFLVGMNDEAQAPTFAPLGALGRLRRGGPMTLEIGTSAGVRRRGAGAC